MSWLKKDAHLSGSRLGLRLRSVVVVAASITRWLSSEMEKCGKTIGKTCAKCWEVVRTAPGSFAAAEVLRKVPEGKVKLCLSKNGQQSVCRGIEESARRKAELVCVEKWASECFQRHWESIRTKAELGGVEK